MTFSIAKVVDKTRVVSAFNFKLETLNLSLATMISLPLAFKSSSRIFHPHMCNTECGERFYFRLDTRSWDNSQGEQLVCGWELFIIDSDNKRRCYYTSQIDVESQLPHGMGTLHSGSRGCGRMGRWSEMRMRRFRL